jgi:adenine-specific DNA-methyltransferase
MNYIGSKLSLLTFIESSIEAVVDPTCKSFCDLFSGTASVGAHFKKKGYAVTANDIQYYSYVLSKQYIENNTLPKFANLVGIVPQLETIDILFRSKAVCSYLSALPGIPGFIYNNYCLGGTKGKEFERQYFSDNNGFRCDAIRQQIEHWYQLQKITTPEYFFLLASLLESVDKCANTASVYGAFLKQLKLSAQKDFVLQPALTIVSTQNNLVYNADANKTISSIKGGILYLDPPYNQRQYATNYHILETIARYDNPQVLGKSGLREYANEKSVYCSRPKVKAIFKDLVAQADVQYIFLSYNNEGLLTHTDIEEVLSSRGTYSCYTKSYPRFKADKDKNRTFIATTTTEYLHCVVCN